MRRVATRETGEECADDEQQEADPELVDAATHAIRLRVTQRRDRDTERDVRADELVLYARDLALRAIGPTRVFQVASVFVCVRK